MIDIYHSLDVYTSIAFISMAINGCGKEATGLRFFHFAMH